MHDVSFARCRIPADWSEMCSRWWPQADSALKDEHVGTLNNKPRTSQPRGRYFGDAQGRVGMFAAYLGDADSSNAEHVMLVDLAALRCGGCPCLTLQA